MNSRTLYKRASNDVMWSWEISNHLSELHIYSGTLEGEKTLTIVDIVENKSNRTLDEQSELELEQRIAIQVRNGYFDTIKQAQTQKKFKAMKGYRLELYPTKVDWANAFTQAKLNGYRITTHFEHTGMEMWTYGRLRNYVLSHIRLELANYGIPTGIVLDGEMYYHGTPLQTIVSWCKKKQPSTLLIEYHIYDLAILGMSFVDRQELLHKLIPHDTQHIKVIPTYETHTMDIHNEVHNDYTSKGYEGTVVRNGLEEYEYRKGYRIFKHKDLFSEEFKIVDLWTPVTGSYKGCAWFVLETKEGLTFKASNKGKNKTQRRKQYNNKDTYIGKSATVEYYGKSIDGIPTNNAPVVLIDREGLGDL